ncbi:MAG: hypothetical protein ACRDO4_12875 [Nocardioides sp.]
MSREMLGQATPTTTMKSAARRGVAITSAAMVLTAGVIGASYLLGQRAAPSSGVAEGSEIVARAEQIYARFGGTLEQRNAGFVMRTYVFNHALDDCLDNAGYPEWDWSLSRMYAAPVDPLKAGLWLRSPDGLGRAEYLMALGPHLRAEGEMNNPEYLEGEQDAILTCVRETPAGSEDEAERVTVPPEARTLIDAWNEAIEKYATEQNDPAEYLECMNDAQLTVLEATGLDASELFRALSAQNPPDTAIPLTTDDPHAENPHWQAFLTSQREVDNADWACREDVYSARIEGLLPLIEAFAADHAAEIGKVQTAWESIERQASEVGYHGQTGPLGQ